jgi:hypothetical protein
MGDLGVPARQAGATRGRAAAQRKLCAEGVSRRAAPARSPVTRISPPLRSAGPTAPGFPRWHGKFEQRGGVHRWGQLTTWLGVQRGRLLGCGITLSAQPVLGTTPRRRPLPCGDRRWTKIVHNRHRCSEAITTPSRLEKRNVCVGARQRVLSRHSAHRSQAARSTSPKGDSRTGRRQCCGLEIRMFRSIPSALSQLSIRVGPKMGSGPKLRSTRRAVPAFGS